MSQSHQPQYTDEVRAAMRAQGIPLDDEPEQPRDPLGAPVAGMTRYHIAIEESVQSGIAKPAVVAAMLRAAADALDPPPRKAAYRNLSAVQGDSAHADSR